MKVKIVSVFLAVLLMGLVVLPGCVSRGELNELKAQLAEKDAQIEAQAAQINELGTQIATLNSIIEARDAEIAELREEIKKLTQTAPGEVAKIEIQFSSDPVVCEKEFWSWRVVLREVGGVGVKLNTLIYERYNNGRLIGGSRLVYDSAWIEKWLNSAYLLAYGSADFGAGFPCQDVSYAVFTVYGIDDKSNEIIASGRVTFLQPEEKCGCG